MLVTTYMNNVVFFVFFCQHAQIDAHFVRGCDRKGSKDIFHFISSLKQRQFEQYFYKFTSNIKFTHRNVNLVSSRLNHLVRACKSAYRSFLNMNALLMSGVSPGGTPFVKNCYGNVRFEERLPLLIKGGICYLSLSHFSVSSLSGAQNVKGKQLRKCTTLLSFLSCLSVRPP